MKVSPYLQFNGNCSKAIAFYEKAFGVKADVYKETGNFVSHAELDLGNGYIGLSDTPSGEGKSSFGNGGISISVSLDSIKKVKAVFKKLSAGGKIWEKPEAADWCDCFCTCEDKFGVNWSLMCGEKE
ncbi:MAG: glyoxalase/bleomycin resistance/extradiol dioxygenase family protein [Fibromonadaceae bacterium]|jgi:PhnB protein|nr:glyoxalase/bleomycin resistance/extradiol dioxygenase family protein [Fibromonadaceae bacterium]